MELDRGRVLAIIKAALKEDIGTGDVTTAALVGRYAAGRATIVTREDCVVAGLLVAELAVEQVDYSVRFRPTTNDGAAVGAGKELAYLEGPAASILRAERTMLNFLALLSGIATKTKAYVDRAKPYGVKIMDTRKTFPLLRYLEKYAVVCGGGVNHRMGLYDQALIKDNHIAHRLAAEPPRPKGAVPYGIKDIVQLCRKKIPRGMAVEVEVESIAGFKAALAAKPEIIMLDNMKPAMIKECVALRRTAGAKVFLEASGGITLDTVDAYAKTGIDMISIGELTHSVHSIDLSLEME